MLDFGMGAGKTLTALDAWDKIGPALTLVVCPVSVLGVWRREFHLHVDRPMDVAVLDRGDGRKKAAAAAKAVALARVERRPLVLVVNYESVWREPLATVLRRAAPGMLILDESHRIKAPGGKAALFLSRLAATAAWKVALSGTPCPHSILDAYAQFRSVAPYVFGWSYTTFKSRYAVVGGHEGKQVVGFQNTDEFERRFHEVALSVKTEDCVDLPEALDHTLEVELGPTAATAYADMEAQLWAEVDAGRIVAKNALAKLLRLQQLTSGIAACDDGREEVIDAAKVEALDDWLEDVPAGEPVVVFCRFTKDLDAVRQLAERRGLRYGEISGRRKDLTEHARMPEGVDLMGVQIQSGGVGIDLTRARLAVYLSLGFNLGDYLQSKARIHRPGQTRPVLFTHLVARRTIDTRVLRALMRRRQVIEAILAERREPALAA